METSLTSMAWTNRLRRLYGDWAEAFTRPQMLTVGRFAWQALGSQPRSRVAYIAQVVCILILPFGLATVSRLPPLPKLQGSYTTVITPEDLPASFGSTNLSGDDIAFLSGEWQIEFIQDSHSDGHFTMTKNGEVMILNGRYTLNNNSLAFSDETGPAACNKDPRQNYRTGVYRWGHSGDELAFLVIDDKCGGRTIVLGTHPWVKLK
jgi:hypothetical protein